MTDPAASVSPSVTSARAAHAAAGFGVTTAAIVLLTIAALYFGRDIFVPLALAVLLSFMLAPPLEWLRRVHVPRVPAVLLVVTLAFALIGALSVVVGSQVVLLAENLPTYQQTMLEKIRSIRAAAPGGGMIDRATTTLQALSEELSSSPDPLAGGEATATGRAAGEPISVQIEPAERQPFEVIRTVLGPLLGPVGTAGIVIVFVIFILLERHDLRDRVIRLAGADLHRTTEALNEAARRVSGYLLMQLIVNATYGVPIGIGLYFIGVPNAFLWGLLATLLRFVPYLGPFIAALFPLALAFAVDPGWDMLFWTVVLILGMELISNNFIEPWLYGSSTGLSPVAIILAAIFWTTLWGVVGLMLATPLTVCLVVLGRYVPQLAFLNVLFGSDPVLAPEERLYQRLLAGNVEEAIDIAEAHVEKNSLPAFYDTVGLPALRLAANDHQCGAADADGTSKIAGGARAIVRDLREQVGKSEGGEGDRSPIRWLGSPALCIAGRGELDAAAAAMLAHALEHKGIGARELPAESIAPDVIGNLDLAGVEVVCLSYFDPRPQAYARFVCRRLKRRAPHLRIVLGVWNPALEGETIDQLAAAAGAEAVTASLTEAVRCLEGMVGQAASAWTPPPTPAGEQDRLEALYASGLLETRSGGYLDRLAGKVADAFGMPIALVSLIDESCQLWKGAAGLPGDLAASRQSTREMSICGHVVAADAPLVVEDTARDPRFAGNPFLRERSIRFYAGVPIRTTSGHVIGSLCVIDTRPRTLNARDIKLLQVIADDLMRNIERPAGAASGLPAGQPALLDQTSAADPDRQRLLPTEHELADRAIA